MRRCASISWGGPRRPRSGLTMAGKFITLEGIDGVGKSTQMRAVRRLLEDAGLRCVLTREPGGTPLAEEIRGLLLAKRDEPMAPMTELLLMFAARNQHLEQVIRPALAAGAWVVSERFTDASYAYQGGGRQMGEAAVESLERLVQGPLQPDLTIFLDLGPRAAAQRMAGREGDRFEAEQAEFFDRVRDAYLRLARRHGRIVVADAGRPADEVGEAVAQLLRPLLPSSGNG